MPRPTSLLSPVLSLVLLAACGGHPPGQEPAPSRPAEATTPERPAQLAGIPAPSALAVTPSPSPSPSPAASSPSPDDWREGALIQFEAPQRPGESNRDIFVYNARLETVVAIVGANSPADESSPKLSSDRTWLAFQRTTTAADGTSHADILLLNTRTQQLHTLPRLNAEGADATSPDISGDGHWIAYIFSDGAPPQIKLYHVETGTDYALPGLNRPFGDVASPRLAHDNRRIAFSAATRLPDGGVSTQDIYLYDLPSATLWTLPHLNSPFNEENPDLKRDNRHMLFTSDRFGSRDIFEVDLETGRLDNLSFANTAAFDEASPRYYGQDDADIRYRLFPDPAEAPDTYLLRVLERKTGRIDTLPVANRLLEQPRAPW